MFEPMREITHHHCQPAGEPLRVYATDAPSFGGASHAYVIARPSAADETPAALSHLQFQRGPLKEHGVNGITQEALLAVLIDRLQGFQEGPFGCVQNYKALMALKDAMHWMNDRTRRRDERGVEGTMTP